MRKYVLKKAYPGSPKVGTEVIFNEKFNRWYYRGSIVELEWNESNGQSWSVAAFEHYNEYWQEVIDGNEYEILSFKNESFGTIWIKAENGKFYPEHGANSYSNKYQIEYHTRFEGTSESWFLSFPDKWKIHSIKRNSDEEIFTVNDDIIEQNEHSKIQYFEILDGFLRIRINHQITKGSSTILISSNFEKYIPKKPLFTTEDGVHIYEGDEYYFINSNNNICHRLNAAFGRYVKIPNYYFSTKEKAQEYLDSLKPKALFTTVDGKEIFAGDPFYVYDKHFYKCINAKGGQFQNERWQNFRYANINTVLNLVFRNTPCLSLEDVASIYKTANREKPENPNDQGTKLYNLVRKKLNK